MTDRKTKKYLSSVDEEKMLDEAKAKGIDIYKLAQRYDISVSTLRKRLIAAGIGFHRGVTTGEVNEGPVSERPLAAQLVELGHAISLANEIAGPLGYEVVVNHR